MKTSNTYITTLQRPLIHKQADEETTACGATISSLGAYPVPVLESEINLFFKCSNCFCLTAKAQQ